MKHFKVVGIDTGFLARGGGNCMNEVRLKKEKLSKNVMQVASSVEIIKTKRVLFIKQPTMDNNNEPTTARLCHNYGYV